MCGVRCFAINIYQMQIVCSLFGLLFFPPCPSFFSRNHQCRRSQCAQSHGAFSSARTIICRAGGIENSLRVFTRHKAADKCGQIMAIPPFSIRYSLADGLFLL